MHVAVVNGEVKIVRSDWLLKPRSLRLSRLSFKEEDEDEIGCCTLSDRGKGSRDRDRGRSMDLVEERD